MWKETSNYRALKSKGFFFLIFHIFNTFFQPECIVSDTVIRTMVVRHSTQILHGPIFSSRAPALISTPAAATQVPPVPVLSAATPIPPTPVFSPAAAAPAPAQVSTPADPVEEMDTTA